MIKFKPGDLVVLYQPTDYLKYLGVVAYDFKAGYYYYLKEKTIGLVLYHTRAISVCALIGDQLFEVNCSELKLLKRNMGNSRVTK